MKKNTVLQFVKHRLTGQMMIALHEHQGMIFCKYTNTAGEYKVDYFERHELEFIESNG